MESIAAKWVSGNGLRMIRQIERQAFVDGNVWMQLPLDYHDSIEFFATLSTLWPPCFFWYDWGRWGFHDLDAKVPALQELRQWPAEDIDNVLHAAQQLPPLLLEVLPALDEAAKGSLDESGNPLIDGLNWKWSHAEYLCFRHQLSLVAWGEFYLRLNYLCHSQSQQPVALLSCVKACNMKDGLVYILNIMHGFQRQARLWWKFLAVVHSQSKAQHLQQLCQSDFARYPRA